MTRRLTTTIGIAMTLGALAVGCGEPIARVEKVGAFVSEVHLLDAVTGKCVKLASDNTVHSTVNMTLAKAADCVPAARTLTNSKGALDGR